MNRSGGGEEGEVEGVLVCCLPWSFTIDHASLSRRSTGPTPHRHFQHVLSQMRLYLFFLMIYRRVSLTVGVYILR